MLRVVARWVRLHVAPFGSSAYADERAAMRAAGLAKWQGQW